MTENCRKRQNQQNRNVKDSMILALVCAIFKSAKKNKIFQKICEIFAIPGVYIAEGPIASLYFTAPKQCTAPIAPLCKGSCQRQLTEGLELERS